MHPGLSESSSFLNFRYAGVLIPILALKIGLFRENTLDFFIKNCFFFCMESYFSHFKKNSPQIRITNQFGEVLHGSNARKYTFFQNLRPTKISILNLRVNSNLKNNFHTTATTRTKKQGSSRHLPAQSINSYTRVRCEIFSTPSKLMIKTSVRHH